MKFRFLGNTGIQVSCLCLGSMTFGSETNKAPAKAIFNRCRDAGINFFDSANVYSGGKSESILGELISDCRDELIISTKFGDPVGSAPNLKGASRRNIIAALEASLNRLQTDYIDFYFLHRFDVHTPLEETLRALDDLVSQGKVRYIGVSNFAAWQIAKALCVSALNGWIQIHCIQPMYNLVKRQAEVEILPLAQSENLGVMTYNPLGAGILTGKYGKDHKSDSGRLTESDMYKKRYSQQWMYDAAVRFTEFASANGFHPVSLAVAWVAYHPAVTAPIIGARNVEQLEASIKSMDIRMTQELYDQVSQLTPTPPPATDRLEERYKDKDSPDG
ncbi:MAG: aldo/keto reductase [Desulfobacterales bacterium]|nr:MAG: aldo/keto reductase [Desulfobacterales bacterium]